MAFAPRQRILSGLRFFSRVLHEVVVEDVPGVCYNCANAVNNVGRNMKSKRTNRFILAGTFLLFFILLIGSLAYASTLEEVRAAIEKKGAHWVAEETSISIVPDRERKLRLGLIMPESTEKEKILPLREPLGELPTRLDWRANDGSYVTPVKDQGSGICSSCWAFATTAALESNILIRDNLPGFNENRAEEILLSCSAAGNCNGGDISDAANYIRDMGLPPEPYFPYTASPGDNQCSNAMSGWEAHTARINGWHWVTTTNPVNLGAIKHTLNTHGPLVTTLIVFTDFNYYKGGIYEYVTGSYEDGHAVLIVGYVDDQSVQGGGYFIAKNSWGPSWGEDGYFRIAYSQANSPVYFGRWTMAYENQLFSVHKGTVGTEITLTGVSFGAKKGKVRVGGKTCMVSHWANESVTCTVKIGLPPGPYEVTVIRKEPKGAKPITSQGAFTMIAPEITSIRPVLGSTPEEYTIDGNYFGSKKGKVYLEYEQNGQLKKKSCKVTEWSMYNKPVDGESHIKFIVPKLPKGLLPGPYTLTIVNKVGKNSITFTVE